MEKVYIFGHRNPDTDSVCGSIALAYLKNKLGTRAEPFILSDINPETAFALKTFKYDIPRYLNDVKVQLKDVHYNKKYILNENASIMEAIELMNQYNITGLPLVDNEKKFKGYVSLKEIAANTIYNDSLVLDTTMANIVSVLEAKESIQFDEEINGYIHIAAFSEQGMENVDEKTILVVGNRERIIEDALKKKVKMIILIKGGMLSKKMRALVKKNRVNVVFTEKGAFKIARILCFANPIQSIKRNQETITFHSSDYFTDFEEATSKLKHTNYPILGNNDTCLGMLRTIDAHEIERRKVILVDHNMVRQSVDGLYEAEIVEVIDHHNIGDINTSKPINFRTMSVGSVNTIIYYLFKENNIKIPKQIAGLMVSGILSDTLLLQSPTTTMKDKIVAEDLSHIAGIDMKKYGLSLLESSVSIEGLSANEIIYKDCKTYTVGENTMAIAQVFTTDINVFKPHFEALVSELDRMEENNQYKVCCLFITNFLTNNSYVFFSKHSKHILELAYGIEELKEGQLFKKIVSRKKQIIPNLMEVLERI